MADIKIKQKSFKNDNTFQPNHLHLEISGKDVNYVLVNTIRRTILNNIPCYAFNEINILKNTSVYNNDYMRNRIEMFPIQNIKNNFDFNEYKKLSVYTRNRSSYADNETEQTDNMDNLNVLNMYVNKRNNTKDMMNVTTDHCEFYNNGQKIKSIYDKPLLVCKLKPNEELELTAIANKGVGINHAKYSSCSTCVFEKINDNKFLLKIYPISQFSSEEIFNMSIQIIKFMIKELQDNFNKTKFSSKSSGIITLENYSHTIGNLISRYLQDNNNIEFSGYKVDHLLVRNVSIHYKHNDVKSINEILNKTLEKLIKLFNNFKI